MKYFFFKDKKKIFYLIFLFFFSIIINQYYGNLGINPIDSFFSFNSGYDILNGYYPFKDYWTITGPFVAFTQAIFFKIFGVSWSSYVLHASFFNFIIASSLFYTLAKFKLNIHYCFLYSILLSIIASPSAGTPYVDQQSSFLSLIAVFCFILALFTNSKIYWFFLPIILVISFLTKQAPTGHIFLILSFLSIIYFFFNFNIKKILYGFLGSVIIISLFFLTLSLGKISLLSFFQQYILFPLSLGESRLDFLFPLEFNRIFLRYKLIHLSYLLLMVILIKNIKNNYKYLITKESLIIFSLVGTSYVLIIHQLMTINGIYIYFIIPVLASFSHIYFLKNFKGKQYILYSLIFLVISSTFYYAFNYVHKRDFMDLRKVSMNKSIDANIIDKKLNKLRWITTIYPDNPNVEISNLQEAIAIIKEDNRKKTIITDYQFISVILNIYDFSPSQVWFGFHVIPDVNSKLYKIYKNFFLNQIKKNKIEIAYVVKPLWGGDDIFVRPLSKNCYQKKIITKILDEYKLLPCDELKN